MGAQHDGFSPAFVVGAERSGTTLLATVLSRHSKLVFTPETHFFKDVLPVRGDHVEMVGKLLAAPRIADLRLDRDALLERFNACTPDGKHLLRAMLEQYAEQFGKPRVGEKTPGHLRFAPTILSWYPKARIICIVRDGRDVARSLVRAPWTHADPIRHLLDWERAARRCRELAAREPERVRLVRLEDLLMDPSSVVSDLDAFLGLTYEPGQLDPDGDSPVVPAWERRWKDQADRPLDPSRIGAWRKRTGERERLRFAALVGHELRAHGYADADLESCSPAARARLLTWATAMRVRNCRPVYQTTKFFTRVGERTPEPTSERPDWDVESMRQEAPDQR